MFKKGSITKKIVLPMTLLIIVQSVFLIGTILWGTTLKEINAKSIENMNSKNSVNALYLQNQMQHSWSNLEELKLSIMRHIEINRYFSDDLLDDLEKNEILNTFSEELLLTMKINQVTDIFIIFAEDKLDKRCLYIKNRMLNSNSYDKKNFTIEVAPVSIRDQLLNKGLDQSVNYKVRADFNIATGTDFYSKTSTIHENVYEGYWSGDFKIHGEKGEDILSYTIPIYVNKKLVAILGSGVLLKTVISKNFLTLEDQNVKIFGKILFQKSNNVLTKIYAKNYSTNKMEDLVKLSEFEETSYTNIFYLNTKNEDSLYASIFELKLYNQNNFSQTWYLATLIDESSLFSSNYKIISQVGYVSIVGIIICVLMQIFISMRLVKPIHRVTHKIKNSSVSDQFTIDETGIEEIDFLTREIKDLVKNIYDTPMKISQIIKLAEIRIAAFEFDMARNYVLTTDNFFELLELDMPVKQMSIEEFKLIFKIIKIDIFEEAKDNEYQFIRKNKTGKEVFLSLKMIKNAKNYIGVIRDVTSDVLEKQKIEYERDYDSLTGLLNRRGFYNKCEQIFEKNHREMALIMFDLDKLKRINDQYGHDYGDIYIQKAGEILQRFEDDKSIACHISGDEFILLLHSMKSKEMIKMRVKEVEESFKNAFVEIKDDLLPLRISAGICFYSEKNNHLERLRKYADQSMYKSKHLKNRQFVFYDEKEESESE